MEALQAAYQMTLPEADSTHALERLKGFVFGYILHGRTINSGGSG